MKSITEPTTINEDEGLGVARNRNGGRITKSVQIKAPNFQTAVFKIVGTAPLVVHRFSSKAKRELEQNQEEGKSSSSKRKREPKPSSQTYFEARYISAEGWDGFNASSVRNAIISVCRLVNFKMTLAKMSVFVIADGVDKFEPQIPLIRIIGSPVQQEDIAYTHAGTPYVTVRPAYHDWSAFVTIRWDADQFSLDDVTNLLMRVGEQCGLCEGRPDSKNSGGMGWGTFKVEFYENRNTKRTDTHSKEAQRQTSATSVG